MDQAPFPKLSDQEAAHIAAILAAAACSMLSADNNQGFALQESRRLFEEQYKFIKKSQWEAAPGLGGGGLG